MSPILEFVYIVIDSLLTLIVWLVIANAVMSWLIAFDIINLRNRAAYSAVRMLERVTAPLLRPFRKIIPPMGGMDLSPVVLIIIIMAAQRALLPALFRWLNGLVGGGVSL
ncbi:MAG TPA: YggT family protein [Caulobacteraceae bacterium]|jgi:YggT family protein|nr:YggT family protein [Caulobacteraceae bacterium]